MSERAGYFKMAVAVVMASAPVSVLARLGEEDYFEWENQPMPEPASFWMMTGEAAVALVLWVVPIAVIFYLLYYLVSLPMRREERARFVLDLLESGLREGRNVEETICSISKTRDPSVGVRFHLAAAYLESGRRWSEALERVPRLLPPQVIWMLRSGEEMGDVRKVLPVCRSLLAGGRSRVEGGLSYLMALLFVITPASGLMFLLIWFASARMMSVFVEMIGRTPEPALTLMGWGAKLAVVQVGLGLVVYAGALLYVGGPRLLGWIEAGLFLPVSDWGYYYIPWRRNRIKRDFTAMLALLLDAEIPEERAVELAARSTANLCFIRQAEKVVNDLRAGISLPEAVRKLDRAGEFGWRLKNAWRGPGDFSRGIAGWLEALETKAFQQEQTAAHWATTGLVLLNGVIVGLFIAGLFSGLIMILEEGLLW
jgi:hypothetical protein